MFQTADTSLKNVGPQNGNDNIALNTMTNDNDSQHTQLKITASLSSNLIMLICLAHHL